MTERIVNNCIVFGPRRGNARIIQNFAETAGRTVLTPENEAVRVAPDALTFEVEPVVSLAVAVWPPEVPPSDGSQLYSTTNELRY